MELNWRFCCLSEGGDVVCCYMLLKYLINSNKLKFALLMTLNWSACRLLQVAFPCTDFSRSACLWFPLSNLECFIDPERDWEESCLSSVTAVGPESKDDATAFMPPPVAPALPAWSPNSATDRVLHSFSDMNPWPLFSGSIQSCLSNNQFFHWLYYRILGSEYQIHQC